MGESAVSGLWCVWPKLAACRPGGALPPSAANPTFHRKTRALHRRSAPKRRGHSSSFPGHAPPHPLPRLRSLYNPHKRTTHRGAFFPGLPSPELVEGFNNSPASGCADTELSGFGRFKEYVLPYILGASMYSLRRQHPLRTSESSASLSKAARQSQCTAPSGFAGTSGSGLSKRIPESHALPLRRSAPHSSRHSSLARAQSQPGDPQGTHEEEREHLGRRGSSSGQTPCCILENLFDLRAGYTGEPGQVIVNPCTVLEILKERRNWHPRAAKHPRPALNFRAAFHGGAFRPVEHGKSLP